MRYDAELGLHTLRYIVDDVESLWPEWKIPGFGPRRRVAMAGLPAVPRHAVGRRRRPPLYRASLRVKQSQPPRGADGDVPRHRRSGSGWGTLGIFHSGTLATISSAVLLSRTSLSSLTKRSARTTTTLWSRCLRPGRTKVDSWPSSWSLRSQSRGGGHGRDGQAPQAVCGGGDGGDGGLNSVYELNVVSWPD